MFGQCIFVAHGGGGVFGGGEYYSFEVIAMCIIETTEGEDVGGGVSPSHSGDFLDFGVLKPGFWWVISFKF